MKFQKYYIGKNIPILANKKDFKTFNHFKKTATIKPQALYLFAKKSATAHQRSCRGFFVYEKLLCYL